MNDKKRIIALLVIGVLIATVLALGITRAFMNPIMPGDSVTDIEINSCAKLTLLENSTAINLTNTAPMSDNMGLNTTPYEFTIKSSCEESVKYKVYLGVLSSNTLNASKIKYAIKEKNSGNIVANGNLSTVGTSDFTSDELNQIKSGVGTTSSIYTIMNETIPSKTEMAYELYLWVDGNAGNEVKNQTFTAGVLAKTTESITGELFSSHIINQYTTQGANGLYKHDSTLANGAEDNSYRYSGASDAVNNYVCFASDATTCPNDNLYRIIGVFGNKVKLIKSDYATITQLGTDGEYYGLYGSAPTSYKGTLDTTTEIGRYYWNRINNDLAYNETGNSSMWSYSELNKTNLNKNYIAYLNSQEAKWANMIANTLWNIGGMSVDNGRFSNAKIAYEYELGYKSEKGNTYEAKIGLMYVSDYYYAASPTYWTYPGYTSSSRPDVNGNYGELYDYRAAKDSNWLYMGLLDRTISCVLGGGSAFNINTTGNMLNHYTNTYNHAIRPVFYLNVDVEYVSGDGSQTTPYRIQLG